MKQWRKKNRSLQTDGIVYSTLIHHSPLLRFFYPFLLFIFISFNIFCQAPDEGLKLLRESVLKARNDSDRINANDSFIIALERILESEISYDMNFDSLKQIGLLRSPDNAFRMITWNLPFNDETHKYYCYIQIPQKKGRKYSVGKFLDKTAEGPVSEREVVTKDNWYGALYYEVIPYSFKKKTYYALLGWDGNNALTRKKIIDILYFTNDGEVNLGDDVFMTGPTSRKRIIFEYSSQVLMSLKYHPERKQIVFDHLSPAQPEMEGMFQYYGPDFSYDAFELKKGKWIFIGDVDIRSDTENPVYNPEIKKGKEIYSPKP